MLLIGQNEAHYGPLIGQYSPGDTLTLLPLMDHGDVQTPLGRGGAALVLHTRMTHLMMIMMMIMAMTVTETVTQR